MHANRGFLSRDINEKLPFMITPDKEITSRTIYHICLAPRSNRHRPSVEDVAAHMDDLRGIMRKCDEEEKEEETNINEEVDVGKQTQNRKMVYPECSTSGRPESLGLWTHWTWP